MDARERAAAQALEFFEGLWRKGDYWSFEGDPFEQARFNDLTATISDRHYPRVLEVGCGSGEMTRRLAGLADRVIAIDISPTAIERARQSLADMSNIECRQANIMQYDLGDDGAWDLIVMSETIYYLGWLYPMFDVGWMVSELHRTSQNGGRVLLANTLGEIGDSLVLPWLIRTYRDLFRNVGFVVENEHLFHGTKDKVDLEVLVTLFTKLPEEEIA